MISDQHQVLITTLVEYQQKIIDLCGRYREDFSAQHHPDLSPLGWHLGHCIYTEIFWVRERLFNLPISNEKLRACYVPRVAKKSERGTTLPEYSELCQWAEDSQKKNLSMLRNYQNKDNNPLMCNYFLLYFLIQHYAQHIETIQMAIAQKMLSEATDFMVAQPLRSSQLQTKTKVLNSGSYIIGAQTDFLPYDNEYPTHQFTTDDIYIAETPVSNSEFLLFIEQSGYQMPQYWSEQGWQWQQQANVSSPEFWRQDAQSNWFGIGLDGAFELMPSYPVCGLNYFEAQAFANWANVRLPHEYEWEATAQNHCLKGTGHVWEWCQNRFHPYTKSQQKFRAFPYDGYSIPYFDRLHFVMRGGSQYTQQAICRTSFRNYYQPDKRHQFSGCRVVFG